MVFEPKDAPREKSAFIDWYHLQTRWSEGHSYDDPSKTAVSLSSWYAEVCRDFPDMNGSSASDLGDVEGNPRATGYSIGRSVIYVDFRWSEADTAYALVRALAVKHGVGFFNASADDGEIWFPPTEHRPDGAAIPGLTLQLEGQQGFSTPSVALIEAAVDWLQPTGGPGFLLLEKHGGGNYVQAGGGKDVCTVEWRETLDGNFRHWVAGLPGGDIEKDIKIPGNGTHFRVKANEQLSNEDVKVILGAFARGVTKPQEFVWRDITAQFGRGSPLRTAKPWWRFWR